MRDNRGRFARWEPMRLFYSAKSAPHMRGWQTRRERRLARVLAHCAALRATIA